MGNPESKIKQEQTRPTSKSVSNLSLIATRKVDSLIKSPKAEPRDKPKLFKRTHFLQKLDKRVIGVVSYLNSQSILETLSKDVGTSIFNSLNVSTMFSDSEAYTDQICNNISYTNTYIDSLSNERGFKVYGLGKNKFKFESLDLIVEPSEPAIATRVIKVPLARDKKTGSMGSPNRSPERKVEEDNPKVFTKKVVNSGKTSLGGNTNNTSTANVFTRGNDGSRTHSNNASFVSSVPVNKTFTARTSPKRKSKSKSKEKAIVKLTLKDLKDISAEMDNSYSGGQYNTNHVYSKKKIPSISETPKYDSTYSTTTSSKFEYNGISNRDRSPVEVSGGYVSKLRQKNDFKIMQDQKDKSKLNKSGIEQPSAGVYKRVSLNNSFTGDYLKTEGDSAKTTKRDEKMFDRFNEKFNEKFSNNKIVINNVKGKSPSPKRVDTAPSRTSLGNNNKPNLKPKVNTVPKPESVKKEKPAVKDLPRNPPSEVPNYWTKMKSRELLTDTKSIERNKSTEPKKIIKIDLSELSDDGDIFEINPKREENKAKLNRIKNKPSINDDIYKTAAGQSSNEYRSKTPKARDAYSIENYLEDDRVSIKKGTPKFEAKRTTFGKVDDIGNYMNNDYDDRFSFNMFVQKVNI
jgi:hypothetical protein